MAIQELMPGLDDAYTQYFRCQESMPLVDTGSEHYMPVLHAGHVGTQFLESMQSIPELMLLLDQSIQELMYSMPLLNASHSWDGILGM